MRPHTKRRARTHTHIHKDTHARTQVDVIVSEWMGYALLYEAMFDSVRLL